jgi:hypothetical protein
MSLGPFSCRHVQRKDVVSLIDKKNAAQVFVHDDSHAAAVRRRSLELSKGYVILRALSPNRVTEAPGFAFQHGILFGVLTRQIGMHNARLGCGRSAHFTSCPKQDPLCSSILGPISGDTAHPTKDEAHHDDPSYVLTLLLSIFWMLYSFTH